MKALYLKLLIVQLSLLPLSALAERGGGGTDVGHGGNVVILPDDSVHLADPYIVRPAVEAVHPFSDFHPSLKTEIEMIGRLMVRLGAAVDERIDSKTLKRNPSDDEKKQARNSRYASRDAQAKFIAMNVENPLTEYVFVDQFPSTCKPVGDIGPVTEGYRVQELGCTQGPTTYILKGMFARLNVRDQALSIIHERMHGLIREFEHHFISDVTQGLGILLDLYNQQRAGQRPLLTEANRKFIKGMLKAMSETGLNEGSPEEEWKFWQDWDVAPGGGIYYQTAQVSPLAYIGVGAMLGEGGIMDAGSELINSTCYLVSCELRDGASVIDTVVAPKVSNQEFNFDTRLFLAVFGRRSVVSGGSSLMASMSSNTGQRIVIGDDAKINGSELSGFSMLKVDRAASLMNAGIVFTPLGRSSVRFEILETASLQNVRTQILAGDLASISDTEYVLSITQNHRLDFKSGPVCDDGRQGVVLKRSLPVESEDVLKGQCRTGL